MIASSGYKWIYFLSLRSHHFHSTTSSDISMINLSGVPNTPSTWMSQECPLCSEGAEVLVQLTQVKGHVADGFILTPKPLLKAIVCILRLLYRLQSKCILLSSKWFSSFASKGFFTPLRATHQLYEKTKVLKIKGWMHISFTWKKTRFNMKIMLEIRYTVSTESTLKKVTHTPSTITLINIKYLNSD